MTNPSSPQQPGQSADYPPGPGSNHTPPQYQQPPGPGGYPQGYGPPPGPPGGYGGPPPKKGGGNKVVFIILGVIAGAIILMCGIGGVLIATAPTTTTTFGANGIDEPAPPGAPAAPDEPAGPGTTKDNPAPIGTEIEVAKGFPIKVTAATMDADLEMSKGNQYMKPEAGKQFVIVDLAVSNNTGKPTSVGQHMKLQLLGSSGVAIQQSFFPTPTPELNTMAQMQPGVTASGRLAFQVPEAELPTVVLLAEPQFTLDTNEDQRFLAIQ